MAPGINFFFTGAVVQPIDSQMKNQATKTGLLFMIAILWAVY
jgi:hypothetical protein